MLDEIVVRCDNILNCLGDFFAHTVTTPNSDTLTVDDAVQRLGSVSGTVQGPGEPHSSSGIPLYQVVTGIVTLDWTRPGSDRRQVADLLAGVGSIRFAGGFDAGRRPRISDSTTSLPTLDFFPALFRAIKI